MRRRMPKVQQHTELTADAGNAVQLDFSIHQLDQALHNGQAKPRSTKAPCDRCISLGERREQLRLYLGSNANSRILHFKAKRCTAWYRCQLMDVQLDPTML